MFKLIQRLLRNLRRWFTSGHCQRCGVHCNEGTCADCLRQREDHWP